MSRNVSITLRLEIHDATAFRAAARLQALADGLTGTDADGYADDAADLGACARMLFDRPDLAPDGCSIVDSEAETCAAV